MAKPVNETASAHKQFNLTQRWRFDGASFVRIAGLLWVVAAGWFVAGDMGFVLGAGLLAVGLVSRPVVTVAVAHTALLAVITDIGSTGSLAELALFEIGLITVLVTERPMNLTVSALTVGAAVALATSFAAIVMEAGILAGSVSIVLGFAAITYVLYRYETFWLLAADDLEDTPRIEDQRSPTEQGVSEQKTTGGGETT
ncbi:hypothetical protein [Natronocalculus amylovorans]|uniref:DUF8163 domain-containing protein n=1 Tax=Natronocalculus amylovorans TaxID=2917812 RepID=A0AAE3FZN8_9EURY|nr:hypothetical protein [Natronocalculus amylovorans]MCL9818289.1 hypothetical protein [Natronocalculus amylovorans]